MAETYTMPSVIKGDTFKEIDFEISVDSVALDLTGYTIECKFRKHTKTGREVKSIDTKSGITVTDAVNGVFTIDAFNCDFDAGIYYYDIEFTDGSGVIDTYIQGTLTVLQDVTY